MSMENLSYNWSDDLDRFMELLDADFEVVIKVGKRISSAWKTERGYAVDMVEFPFDYDADPARDITAFIDPAPEKVAKNLPTERTSRQNMEESFRP